MELNIPRYENVGVIIQDASRVLFWFGFLFLIPMFVSLIYAEPTWFYYPIFTIAVSLPCYFINKRFKETIEPFSRLSLVTLAATWLLIAITATLPFFFIADMKPLDAGFETVSALSTAGFSVIAAPDLTAHSVLFWRAMVAWFGGIGITALAFYKLMKSGSMARIILGEGHNRLRPNLVNTGKEIIKIYSFWTILGIALFVMLGVSVFDSFNFSMTAISSTGMVVHSGDLMYYQQTLPGTYGLINVVLCMLMIASAVSFVAHYRVIKKRNIFYYLKDNEFKLMVGFLAFMLFCIGAYLYAHGQADAIPNMSFEAISSSTTTGFQISSDVFAGMGDFVIGIILILGFVGGSQGSPAGGLKMRRFGILLKLMWTKIRSSALPEDAVLPEMSYGGEVITQKDISSLVMYFFVFVLCIVVSSAVLMGYGFDGLESILISSQAQVGSGLSTVPPIDFVPQVKATLMVVMLLGRLEFWPFFALIAYLAGARR
jgi:trk system potassium uptake protein